MKCKRCNKETKETETPSWCDACLEYFLKQMGDNKNDNTKQNIN